MKSKLKLKKIALHTMLLLAVLVILSAVAIWLGLGPVVHSSAGVILTADLPRHLQC
jgi:hypothetical protein